jgi:hypothetical protein
VGGGGGRGFGLISPPLQPHFHSATGGTSSSGAWTLGGSLGHLGGRSRAPTDTPVGLALLVVGFGAGLSLGNICWMLCDTSVTKKSVTSFVVLYSYGGGHIRRLY